ncbi:MAG: phospholipase [Acidovorax sp. 28-64-14]|uniref:phospholipase D family protein n=1 Tax=Acidovorax sp. 28-64-14 TaxID=1970310 RepID=UPI000BCFA438|nr:phospholipase D-like domain-containing protein [Acidovorax sp. 28-64-14]OYY84976.1 MAG: phospholipase [Acidovorax sp. 28-64-14]
MTPALVSAPRSVLPLRHLPVLWAALLVAVLGGCAELPKNVPRPVSTALETTAGTALATQVQERRAAASGRFESGFLLLSGPQAAYGSRLALVEAAQKTLDLQYYAIHADASTERLLRSVVAAARRGVRVRVLLDDFNTSGADAQVMRLAFEPNIEMRMFNPVAGSRDSSLWRMVSALSDFSRVQQRMHNKLFIADNAMGIAGGRNLGDAYFGHDTSGNFVDLDVLAAGPIVKDLSRSFDSYWNNERAYPVQSLITRKELDALRASAASVEEVDETPTESSSPPEAAPSPVTTASASAAATASPPNATTALEALEAQRSRVWDRKPLNLAAARFVWAPAVVLVDKPAKIPADSAATTEPLAPQPGTPSPRDAVTAVAGQRNALAPAAPVHPVHVASVTPAPKTPTASITASPVGTSTAPTSGTPQAPSAAELEYLESQEDTVVDGLLQLMDQARRDLLIVSPYFVPGPEITAAFAAARARNVRVRVLTNSLASNDAPIAHVGYARHRKTLLAMGVELYEMHSERAMLHSKLVIMDHRLLAVGSMNLDMRSQKQNTEIALLIRSMDLSRRAGASIELALRDAAWHVELDARGGLVWRAPQGSNLQDATSEPGASVPLQLLLLLLGPLAPDHLL